MLTLIPQAQLAAALAVCLLFAGYCAGLLGRSRSHAELRRNAQLTLILLAVSLLLLPLQGVQLLIGTISLQRLQELLLFVLLGLLPAAVTAASSLPRLSRLAARSKPNGTVFSRTTRRRAAEPWLVVPTQAFTIASSAHAALLLSPAVKSSPTALAVVLLALPFLVTLLAFRQQLRYKHVHRLGEALLVTRMNRMKQGVLLTAAAATIPLLLTTEQRDPSQETPAGPQHASPPQEVSFSPADEALPQAAAAPSHILSAIDNTSHYER